MGKAACLVVLPCQLIGAVVGIGGSIRTIRDACDIAVIVIGVGHHGCSGAVQDGNHVTLQVCDIVVNGVIIGHRCRYAVGIIGKVQRIRTFRHLRQLTAVVDVGIGIRAIRDTCDVTVVVISVGIGNIEPTGIYRISGNLGAGFSVCGIGDQGTTEPSPCPLLVPLLLEGTLSNTPSIVIINIVIPAFFRQRY